MLQSIDVQPQPSLHAPFLAVVAALLIAVTGSVAAEEPVEIRGHARCIEGVPASTAVTRDDPCNRPDAGFVFDTDAGRTFAMIEGDPKAGMFADPEVRARDLVLRGWLRPGDAFEILSVFSVIDGRRHHLHYRCDVCDITASAPGPCWCCGADFELREVAVDSPES